MGFFFNIASTSYIDNTNRNLFFYPINFNILNKELCQKLIRILKMNPLDIKLEKMDYIFYQGKILLTPSQSSIINQKNIANPYLIYIFSLSFENILYANYRLEVVLSFINSNDLNNNFSRIFREENIMKLFDENYTNNLIAKYNCKNYVIIKETPRQLTKSINILDEKEKVLNNNLFFLIYLYKEYSIFYQIINGLKNDIHHSSEDPNNYSFYLIDSNYLNEIESLLCFQEVAKILNNNQEFNSNLFQDNNINKEILEQLKCKLSSNTLKMLKENSDKILKTKLSNKNIISPLCITVDNEKKYYYQNCRIINRAIIELIIKIDSNINSKIKIINYFIDKEKIIILIDENLINIGFLTDKKEFIVEYIIQTNYDHLNSHIIKHIFQEFKNNGFKYIEQFNIFGCKNYDLKNYKLEVRITKLKGNNTYLDIFDISNKLKALLLLSMSINKDKNFNLKQDFEKVFLINISWLLNYNYQKINNFIKNNEEIIKFIKNNDIINLLYNQIAFNFIISKIGIQTIKTIRRKYI